MKTYLAIIKCRLFALLQYRVAVVAGMLTQIFWGIVNIMILSAFYREEQTSSPLSLQQAINFIWMGQALLQLIPWSIDKELEAQIKNGNVAYELVRPINLYWLWFTRSLTMRIIPTAIRCFPIFLAAGFLGLSRPASIASAGLFAGSLIFSTLLSTAITTTVVISLFWTLSGEGIQRLLPHLTVLLTGIVVPLPLFPAWMQTFLSLQPFRGILDIPIRFYNGIIPPQEAVYYLGFQLVWAVVFIVCGKLFLRFAMKRIELQGG